jgi:predicted transcriptional regulator with HTH domain
MPLISLKKQEKIQEQILAFLFSKFPQQLFTSEIAEEIARDEEFVKKLLIKLNSKNLIVKIKKNSEGIKYVRRLRWRLSNKTYEIYKQSQ